MERLRYRAKLRSTHPELPKCDNLRNWEIGPLGEMTVEKYGTWAGWKQNGKWVNGEGQVDLVVTPIGGFGWMVAEDVLDYYVVRRIEGNTRNAFLVNFARCALNPIRGGANIMHWKRPWYRRSRDARRVYESRHRGEDGVTVSQRGKSQGAPLGQALFSGIRF
jgi:hypothetical protein